MGRTSTGVKFFLKYPKADVTPIKVVFCYNSMQLYYYERKLSIPTKFWNEKNQRAKQMRIFENYAEINNTLDNIESAILDCYRKYKNEFHSEPPLEELREMVRVKRGTSKVISSKTLELIDFIEIFIQEARDGKYINRVRGTHIAKTTINTYEQTLNLLRAFMSATSTQLRFEDINLHFHTDFTHFLSNIYLSKESKEHLKINTIGKSLTNIKTFMSVALERNLTTNNLFRSTSFRVIREDVEKIALSEDEINAIEILDLSGNSRLEKVRDMFLIGCETALRISDLKRLKKENIVEKDGNKFISIEMKKTGKPVAIPFTKRITAILDKCLSTTGEFFPKVISDQKANEYIKEIAQQVPKLRELVEINHTKRGKRITKSIPKYELITNHTSRRSFATNWALKGIPYSSIMSITGHKTEKSFARYIKIDEFQSAKLFQLQTAHLNMKVV